MLRPDVTPRVLVAIPAFNEESALPEVLREIRLTNPWVDILVVDDGSTDDTANVAEGLGANVCRLPYNLGVGGAMRTAFKFAQRSGYEAVVQVDADGQHDPAYIPVLVAGLRHSDVVVGARFAGVGDYRVAPGRRGAMRVLAWLVSKLARQPLTDVTSGFRAAGPRAINVFALHYPSEYLGDTVESLMIGFRTGLRISQVPIEMRHRSAGEPSQNGIRSGVYLFRALAALALAGVRQWPVPDVIVGGSGATLGEAP